MRSPVWGRGRIIALLALVILPLIVPLATIIANSTRVRPAFPSLSYGIQAFLWWNSYTRSRDLERVRQMRFEYVKQIVDWTDIQPEPDRPYNWQNMDDVVGEVQYRQLKLVARIGKAPYWAELAPGSSENEPPYDLKALGAFCHDTAARYKGRIAAYQVWNEPNLDREWAGRSPNPAAYVKLLAACYTAIKSVDPGAIVISAPLAPTGSNDATVMRDDLYLAKMFAAGLSQYYDVLGLNAPGYKSPPETSPDDPALQGNRWQVFRHVEDMRAIQVAHGDGMRQIALLEVGWTIDTRDTIVKDGKTIPNPYRWHAVTEIQQSDYLVGAYTYAGQHWRPWVGLMVTIYLPDPTWTLSDEEYWWAIAEPGNDNRVRGAFVWLAVMARYTGDKITPTLDPGDTWYKPLPAPSPTPTAAR